MFDDSALGMVTNWHGLFFEGRDLTSDRRRGRKVEDLDVAKLKNELRKQLDAVENSDQLVNVLTDVTNKLANAEWPLFAQRAAAYAIPSERVRTKTELNRAIRRAFETDGPYFIQVMVPSKNQVYPLIEPGTTPQDIIWREIMPGSARASMRVTSSITRRAVYATRMMSRKCRIGRRPRAAGAATAARATKNTEPSETSAVSASPMPISAEHRSVVHPYVLRSWWCVVMGGGGSPRAPGKQLVLQKDGVETQTIRVITAVPMSSERCASDRDYCKTGLSSGRLMARPPSCRCAAAQAPRWRTTLAGPSGCW